MVGKERNEICSDKRFLIKNKKVFDSIFVL